MAGAPPDECPAAGVRKGAVEGGVLREEEARSSLMNGHEPTVRKNETGMHSGVGKRNKMKCEGPLLFLC